MDKRKGDYINIHTKDGILYGGNQNRLSDPILKKCGCGLIAAADVSLFLSGLSDLDEEAYVNYVESIKKYFLIIPGMGMNGWSLALGLNHIFHKKHMPYVAHWKNAPVSQKSLHRMEEMLYLGLPVILSAGPNFPNVFGKEKVGLYGRLSQERYQKISSMQKHFIVLTSFEKDGMMKVSSWGKCFYMSGKEWKDYATKKSIPLFTNYLCIRKKKPFFTQEPSF